MLVEWLDAFNATTESTGEGPPIHLVPLPRSSQFLDVIEAVFSGMKRAVVHHSDYPDVSAMKKAISLHFADRNSHFKDNPKRAGKKIWDLDFFDDTDNIRSGINDRSGHSAENTFDDVEKLRGCGKRNQFDYRADRQCSGFFVKPIQRFEK